MRRMGQGPRGSTPPGRFYAPRSAGLPAAVLVVCVCCLSAVPMGEGWMDGGEGLPCLHFGVQERGGGLLYCINV